MVENTEIVGFGRLKESGSGRIASLQHNQVAMKPIEISLMKLTPSVFVASGHSRR
ncbi:MAG: hypothetical protein ACI8UO_001639 [Verrucomicrobiales bacterium]